MSLKNITRGLTKTTQSLGAHLQKSPTVHLVEELRKKQGDRKLALGAAGTATGAVGIQATGQKLEENSLKKTQEDNMRRREQQRKNQQVQPMFGIQKKAFLLGYLNKEAAVSLDIEVGDVILSGRYKNKRKVVKELGTDELGQPTVNGMKLLAIRIEKKLPKSKWSRESLDKNASEYTDAIDRHVADTGITPMYMDEDGGNANWINEIGHDNVMLLDSLMRSEGWGQERSEA